MAVVVTGGSGFVGLNVVERLLQRGSDTVLFAIAPPPESALQVFSGLAGKLHVIEGDVRDEADLRRVFQAHAVDKIVHAAAITSGKDRDRSQAREIIQVNLLGTVALLEVARRRQVRRFLYLSSASVYGQSAFGDHKLDEETTIPVPNSLYGITKYAAERTSLYYKSLWGIDLTVARIGTVFGRWEHETGVRDTLSPPLQATRLAYQGSEAVLPREGLRDWTYGPDVADALIALLDLKRPKHDVYNVGSGTQWTIDSWCAKLRDVFPRFSHRIASDESEANVDFHGARDRAPLSITRLVEDTGFQPQFGLDEAIADYREWIGHHRIWRR